MKKLLLVIPIIGIMLALLVLFGVRSPSIRAHPPIRAKITDALMAMEPNHDSIEVVGHVGGEANVVVVEGNYAYVGFGSELAVLDITDLANPTRVGYIVLPHIVTDIYVTSSYVYVATNDGLHIINVSNPTTPTEIGFYAQRGVADVVVANDYAYVVHNTYWNILKHYYSSRFAYFFRIKLNCLPQIWGLNVVIPLYLG